MTSLDKYIIKNNVFHMIKFNNIYLWNLNDILNNISKYDVKIYINGIIQNKPEMFYLNSDFICEFSEINQKMKIRLIHNNVIIVVDNIEPIVLNISSFKCNNHSLTLVVNQNKYCITAKTSYDTKLIIGKFKFENKNIVCEKIFESYHVSVKNIKEVSVLKYPSALQLVQANKYFNDFKMLVVY